MVSNKNSKRLFLKNLKDFYLFSFLTQFFFIKNLKAKSVKPKVVIIGSGFGGGLVLNFYLNFPKF